MLKDSLICISIFSLVIFFIFLQNKKITKSIREDADRIANKHFPLNCEIASATLTNLINYFSLKYNQLNIEARIWQDFGFKKYDSLVIDLAGVVSDTIDHDINPKIFEKCVTLRDVVEIAIQQQKMANKMQ